MNKAVKKYLHRLAFAVFIFLFFHVTSMEHWEDIITWETRHTAHLIFVVSMVMLVWGLVAGVSSRFEQRHGPKIATRLRLIQLFIVSSIITLPVILLASYLVIFVIDPWFEGPVCAEPITKFWQMSLKAEVFLWLVVGFEMLKVYYKHNQQVEHERALMQKELLLSQFQSLKIQVNPHFLFNSFSVLSSLIDDDPKKASQFLSKLSKMYRYILENREANLVTLEEELVFLEDYLYLLETRHEDSIKVDLNLGNDTKDYLLPTLSLQMLIENAVKHNKFSNHDPLLVEVYREGASYLVVQNRLNQKLPVIDSTKIGLDNVRKRFNIQFGKKVIVDHNDAYFTVKLPLLSAVSV